MKSLFFSRLNVIRYFIIGGFLLIFFQAARIQIFGDSRLKSMRAKQYNKHFLLQPKRGPILDRNGEILAFNIQSKSLAANPKKILKKEILADRLSQAISISKEKILEKFQTSRSFIWIKRHLNEDELERLKEEGILNAQGSRIDGLWTSEESKRIYPHQSLASHVVGDVDIDSQGIEGMELWMNEKLKGKTAKFSIIQDALGRAAFFDSTQIQEASDGESVILSLDIILQFKVENALKQAIENTGSKSGTVLIMNSKNGEILVLANFPSFEPSQKREQFQWRRNRALTDGFEPGSIVKPLLLATALSHGWKLEDQIWGEEGSFLIQGHSITEANKKQYEWLSLEKMIQFSSNICASKLALQLEGPVYIDFLKKLGFGKKTGVNFPGEISGYLPNANTISPLTLANLGFGQGMLVNVLQMVRAYACIQNGGWLIQPTFIRDHILKNTSPIPVFSSEISDQLISTLEKVTQSGGTGTRAALANFRVAGKTGTGQKIDPETRRYATDKDVHTFIGFLIGMDPQYIILTQLDEPQNFRFASSTTAPLFQKVLQALIHQYYFTSPPILSKTEEENKLSHLKKRE